MKWLKLLGVVLAILIAIAVAAPLLISIDDYLPRIEKELSARLNEPVKIAQIRLSILPVPHLVVNGIAVGAASDLKVGQVTVTPELSSLFSATRVVRSIEIDSLLLTQKAIEKFPLWIKQHPPKPGERPSVHVRSIRLDDALVRLARFDFGPFDAGVRIDDQGDPAEVTLTTRDGKLKALVIPNKAAANYAISASARSWTPPVGLPLVFEELDIKGVATLKDAQLSEVNARLYGGTVKGGLTAAWQKGLQVKGSFVVNDVETRALMPLLSPGTKVSGRLSARPVFSATAPDAARLAGALRLETPFEVRKGVLYGVDIQKAAMRLLGQGGVVGDTHFEQLSGHLVTDRGVHKFTQLKISSGLLAAEGDVTVTPKKELSGRVNARLNALGTSAAVPLNVAGTVQSPTLLPTTGTVAGAAIGTAILPGIGTGIGAKAGEMIEGLFGKKPAK